jgi:hypothetical protein
MYVGALLMPVLETKLYYRSGKAVGIKMFQQLNDPA